MRRKPTEKTPLDEAKDYIKALTTSRGMLEETIAEQAMRISVAEARIRVLESRADSDRDRIETLKDMIRGHELEAAHHSGYLERVREDDAVREGYQREVNRTELHNVNPREESRRIYSGPMAADYDPGPGKVNRAMPSEARDWRDKHWTQW